MMFFWFALVAIGGYLIGSLNYSIIFSKVFMHSDVRSSGSGNAGSTNFYAKLPAMGAARRRTDRTMLLHRSLFSRIFQV